jgi:membrane protease subunit HflC
MKSIILLIILVAAGIIGLSSALYVVDETEQVIILRFGEVQAVKRTPGLNIKLPFVDVVVTLDKRILRIDAPPVAMPDIEKENLVIDSYARYRITDPVKFRKTLRTESNARSRMADIVTSSLRTEVARRDRIEIIGAEPVLNPNGSQLVDSEGVPIYIGTETRGEILLAVLADVRGQVQEQDLGIEITDVRIKRADFPDEVTPSIYTRMRAERNRIASKFRAEGDEKELKIRADADKQSTIILAEAQKTSNEIRGEGEAEAIKILADALNKDPDFFAFRKSLEAYNNILNTDTTVILSTESDLFKYLQGPYATQDHGKDID